MESKTRRVPVERHAGMTSYRLSKLVAELKCLRGAKKAVLRAMADRYPRIWPSVETIAKDAGFGSTQTRVSLRQLEADNLILPRTHRRGGRGLAVQYEINVLKILSLIEEQRQRETQWRPLPFDDRNPTDSEQNPTVAGQNPTVFVENPTVAVAEQRSNRELTEKRTEKERNSASAQSPPPLSFKSQKPNQEKSFDYFVWLAMKYRALNLTKKQKTQVREIVTTHDDKELVKLGTTLILDSLDIENTYEHAGEKLAENLHEKILALMESRQQAARDAEVLAARMKVERARVEAELERIELARAREEEFVDPLFDFDDAPVVASTTP
jgi:hypothetical protein